MSLAVNKAQCYSRSLDVVVGSPTIIDCTTTPFPLSVSAVPGGGGTLLVETSCSANAVSAPGSATWYAWPHGAVAAAAVDTLQSPVLAVRVTAAVSDGLVELVG